MITIMGVQFLSVKEAANRYGYSVEWFKKKRALKCGPKFIQMEGGTRVLYPIDQTDEWFKKRMREKE